MFSDNLTTSKEYSRVETNTSSSASFEMIPKRSKSEANRDQTGFMMIINRARKSLLRNRKLSPM